MPTIQKILQACPCQPPSCHLERAQQLHRQILNGIPYPQLGGQRIHHNRNLIRFKIGRGWRLLYLLKEGMLEPYCLVTRQQFEKILMRR